MEREMEVIKRMLGNLIKSLPDVVEKERGLFKMGKRDVWLSVKKNRVIVEPIGYYYRSRKEVMEEEFELKDAIKGYLKFGFRLPRLSFEEKRENDKNVLYCMLEGAGIRIEFKPKWYELLNGVNRMVFTEYKNAKKRKKNNMRDILDELQKISRRAERLCKELEMNPK